MISNEQKPSNKDHKPHPRRAASAGEVTFLAANEMEVRTVRGFSDSR